jgi:hypothetical protein
MAQARGHHKETGWEHLPFALQSEHTALALFT